MTSQRPETQGMQFCGEPRLDSCYYCWCSFFRIFSRGDANTTLKIQKSINLASKLSNSAFLRDLFDRSGLHLRVRLIVFREVEMSVSILFSTIQPLRRRARSNSFGFSQMNLKEIKMCFPKSRRMRARMPCRICFEFLFARWKLQIIFYHFFTRLRQRLLSLFFI